MLNTAQKIFRKCLANVALNPVLQQRIGLYQAMLVEAEGESLPSAMFSSWPLVERADLHEKHRGRMMDTQGGRAVTLDGVVGELKLSELHFIKLDVDGYEYPVLAGGRRRLRKFRPAIALELAPHVHSEHGHAFEELIAMLSGAGYPFLDIASRRSIAADPRELRKAIPDGGSMDVLAEVAA